MSLGAVAELRVRGRQRGRVAFAESESDGEDTLVPKQIKYRELTH